MEPRTIISFTERERNTLDVKNKEQLHQFIMMRQMFVILQFFLFEKLDKDQIFKQIDGATLMIGNKGYKLHYYQDEMEAYVGNAEWASLGYYTVQIFEGIKRYCNKTKQFSKIQKKDYFEYFKIVRHSFSHDSRWNYNNTPKEKFPITFDNCILYFNMEKKPMSNKGYNFRTFMSLTDKLLDMVKNDFT